MNPTHVMENGSRAGRVDNDRLRRKHQREWSRVLGMEMDQNEREMKREKPRRNLNKRTSVINGLYRVETKTNARTRERAIGEIR
jgi:hypothetical protein